MLMRVLLISLFMMTMAIGADQPTEFFAQLDRDWADASIKADFAKLDRILADDLTYTHSSGATDTKQDFIDALRTGKRKYLSVEFADVKVRRYGDVAVITSRPKVHTISGGKDSHFNPIFLHIYTKQHGQWRMVAHQATTVAP